MSLRLLTIMFRCIARHVHEGVKQYYVLACHMLATWSRAAVSAYYLLPILSFAMTVLLVICPTRWLLLLWFQVFGLSRCMYHTILWLLTVSLCESQCVHFCSLQHSTTSSICFQYGSGPGPSDGWWCEKAGGDAVGAPREVRVRRLLGKLMRRLGIYF